MQLLFVGVRPEDTDPVLDALRQAGVASRASFIDAHTGIEALTKQSLEFDAVLVAIRGESIDYDRSVATLREALPDTPILAWANDVQSDWLAEAYSSGAWAFALATYPAQAALVIRQAASVRREKENLRLAQRSAQEVQQRESTLLAAARDPVAYVHEGMHIRANQAYLDFFGISDPEEIEGLPLLDLIDPSRSAAVKIMLRSASQGDEISETMMDMQTVDGTPLQARLSMTKSVYEGERCLQVSLRPAQEAGPPAPHVDLQGYAELAAEIEVRQNSDKAANTALLLVSVSDSQAFEGLGLAHARDFMAGLAGRLVEESDQPATVFDIDGRTLGVLVDGIAASHARKWMEEFRERVALHPVHAGVHSMRPLLCMGGVMLGADWTEINQQPFNRVEELWRQSRLSRDIEWFDPSARDREDDMRRKNLLVHIQKSLQEGGMLLAYRPILPLSGDNLEIFEVFIRMRGPDGSVLRPDDFLGLAESNGFGASIDDAAANLAALSIFEARRQKRDPRIILSIGLSSILDEKFAYRLVGLMDEKQIPRDRVIVQIPENIARANQGAVERLAVQKQELGFSLVISRFMGEAESYDMLPWANPQWVKFDESWTRDLPRNDKKQLQLKEMITRIHDAGLVSIADFVRDSPTMTVLYSAQVGYAAGDFLAHETQVMNALEQ